MSLYEQVRAVGTSRTTREDVFDYYRAEYPGSKTNKKGETIENWKGVYATDQAHVSGVKRDSIMRRFQKRGENGATIDKPVSKAHEDEYQALGESLPSIPPDGGYHIEGEVWVKFSDGACEPRDVDLYIRGEDAAKLAKAAEADLAQMVVNHYMEEEGGIDTDEPQARTGDCQPPRLTVSAIEDEEE